MRLALRFLLVLLLAGGIAAVVINQNTVARLRDEHDELLEADAEAKQLAGENQEIQRLRAENAEVHQLILTNKDLPKLRNDVRQLRREADEAQKLRSENDRLQNVPVLSATKVPEGTSMANKFSRDSLRDVGFLAPRATLQTYYAAVTQGNFQRAMDCLSPETAAKLKAEPEEAVRQTLAAQADGFAGYEILGRDQPSPNEIILNIQISNSGEIRSIHFRQIGKEWKMAN